MPLEPVPDDDPGPRLVIGHLEVEVLPPAAPAPASTPSAPRPSAAPRPARADAPRRSPLRFGLGQL
jgi:hypothetical protein